MAIDLINKQPEPVKKAPTGIATLSEKQARDVLRLIKTFQDYNHPRASSKLYTTQDASLPGQPVTKITVEGPESETIFLNTIKEHGLSREILEKAGLTLSKMQIGLSEMEIGAERFEKIQNRAGITLDQANRSELEINLRQSATAFIGGARAAGNTIGRGFQSLDKAATAIAKSRPARGVKTLVAWVSLGAIGVAGAVFGLGIDKKQNDGKFTKFAEQTPEFFEEGLKAAGLDGVATQINDKALEVIHGVYQLEAKWSERFQKRSDAKPLPPKSEDWGKATRASQEAAAQASRAPGN